MPLDSHSHEDAVSLVTALRPTVISRRLVYRGQSDATWPLVPSAFRQGKTFPTERGWQTVGDRQRDLDAVSGGRKGRRYVQAFLEFGALVAFFQAADEAGLTLPEDSQIIRSKLDSESFDDNVWPDLELRSILALAQHHGLPTRLLDWTWDWRVAAFFAAREAIKGQTEHLAVWRLDANDLRVHTRLVYESYSPHPQGTAPRVEPKMPHVLHLVTAPGATNPNLRAQKGLFTLLQIAPGLESPGFDLWTSLDVLAERDTGRGSISLSKHTLPTSEGPELLHILALEEVTAATVYPGYGGVVQSLEDRRLWDRWMRSE